MASEKKNLKTEHALEATSFKEKNGVKDGSCAKMEINTKAITNVGKRTDSEPLLGKLQGRAILENGSMT